MDFSTDETQRFANLPPQLVEAEAHYRKLMDGFVIGQGFVRIEALREHHNHSIKSSLEIANNSNTLSEESKKSIETILDNLFTHYESLNLEEQPKEKERGLLRRNPAIGIDLGTTNCSVAVYENGKIRLIKNDIGPSKTPSFVAFHSNDNDDNDNDADDPVAGDVAKKLAHAYPQTTIFDIKLMIGRQFTDPQIQKNINLQRWPFELKQCSTTGEILIKTGQNNKWTTPEVILSYLIRYLKKTAEEALDSVVHNAVVATPAYFNDHQRELTKKACEEAGLNVIQLVNELTASAIGYNEHKIPTNTNKTKNTKNNQESSEGPRNVLIFDLGGGTFDVAIVTINGKDINIEAIGGDSCIGGQIFDNNMVDYCIQEFKRKHDIDLGTGTGDTTTAESSSLYDIEDKIQVSSLFRRLQMECEEQKRFFTHLNKVWIKLEDIRNGQGLNIPISREAFESVNLSLFQKCMDIVEKVIEDAGLQKTDIQDIVLVGGSSKILRVQQMLTELFDGKELWLADEAVAVGAAMLAYYAQTGNPATPTNISIQEPIHFVPPASPPVAPVPELVNTPVKVIAVFPKEKSQSQSTDSALLTRSSYRKISSESPATATITTADLVKESQRVCLDADRGIEIRQDSEKSVNNITEVTNASDSVTVLSPVKPAITKRKLMPVAFAENPIVNGYAECAPVPVPVPLDTTVKIVPSNANVVVDSDSITAAEGQYKLTAVDNFVVSPPVVNNAPSPQPQDVGQINTAEDFSRTNKKHLPFIEFKGYLKRKILQVKGKPVTGKKSDWENVFVALRGGYLQICKDERSCQDNEDLANLIDIDNAICDSKDYLGEQRSFILKLSSSQYQFLAEEASVIKQWVDKIRQNSNLPPIIQRAHPLKYSFKSKTLLKDLQNYTETNKPKLSDDILRELPLSGTSYEKEEAATNASDLLRSETTKEHVICCNYGTQITVTGTGHLPKMKAVLNNEINPPLLTHHQKPSFQLPIQRYKADTPGGSGSTLIITNTFDQPDNGELQSYEVGVEKDHELMKELFQDVLKNDVMSCRNVTSTALDGILKEFKRSCINKNSDYCTVIIMSRGSIDPNSVLMSDIKTVDFYQHIFNKFNHDDFPDFLSKPKLFFLECCDGSLDFIDYKNGCKSGRSQADMPTESECERVGHGMILDYFISRASFPRSRTYREVGCSSYYFQAIYEVFKAFWKTKDLELMHKLASGGVAEMWSFLSNYEQWPSEWGVQQPLQINELRYPFFFLQREIS